MRLTNWLSGRTHQVLLEAVAQLQRENARLSAENVLLRSNGKEWQDRYEYLRKQTLGQGWGESLHAVD